MTFPVEKPCSMLACQSEAETWIYVMVTRPSWLLEAGSEIEIQVAVCKAHHDAVLEVTRESND